jgi:hypothetical protein
MAAVMSRRLMLTGSTLRPRLQGVQGRAGGGICAITVWRWSAKALRPVMDQTFAPDRSSLRRTSAWKAAHIGKIVLRRLIDRPEITGGFIALT